MVFSNSEPDRELAFYNIPPLRTGATFCNLWALRPVNDNLLVSTVDRPRPLEYYWRILTIQFHA